VLVTADPRRRNAADEATHRRAPPRRPARRRLAPAPSTGCEPDRRPPPRRRRRPGRDLLRSGRRGTPGPVGRFVRLHVRSRGINAGLRGHLCERILIVGAMAVSPDFPSRFAATLHRASFARRPRTRRARAFRDAHRGASASPGLVARPADGVHRTFEGLAAGELQRRPRAGHLGPHHRSISSTIVVRASWPGSPACSALQTRASGRGRGRDLGIDATIPASCYPRRGRRRRLSVPPARPRARSVVLSIKRPRCCSQPGARSDAARPAGASTAPRPPNARGRLRLARPNPGWWRQVVIVRGWFCGRRRRCLRARVRW
jgi:hypothetical protein